MTTTTISDASIGATDSVAELLLGVGDRDPAAWDEIVRRYGKLVSSTVRSFRLQETDALDAVQTTWLRLVENAHQIKFPEKLGGWLVTTARRECLRILRALQQLRDKLGEHELGPRSPRPQNLRSGYPSSHNRPAGRRPSFSSAT